MIKQPDIPEEPEERPQPKLQRGLSRMLGLAAPRVQPQLGKDSRQTTNGRRRLENCGVTILTSLRLRRLCLTILLVGQFWSLPS